MLIDLVALLIVALAAFAGWRRGGVATALHVAGWVVGLVVGLRVATLLSESLSPAAHVLLGLLCALGGLVVGGALGNLVGRHATSAVARLHLGLLDRAAGTVVRGLGALLVVWLVLALVVAIGPASWASRARASGLLSNGGVPIVSSVVSGVGDAIDGAAPSDVAGLVPVLNVGTTSPAVVRSVRSASAASVVEIAASGCRGSVVGTRFSVGDGLIVTNAHVVRAADDISVEAASGEYPATQVVVDRRADLAVLRVPGSDIPALTLVAGDAANGTRAVVLGHPHGGPLRAVPAVIEQRVPVPDPGLSDGLALHLAYRVRADIQPGNSGSPLLDRSGRVLGVVNATGGGEQGYAITDSELRPDLQLARTTTTAADTGSCT